MIVRGVTLAGGLAGAVSMSQFPEFSQQYLQRLGGAVDELSRVVDDFDRSALAVDKTRAEALASLTGSEFLERRRADMTATFDRFDRLSEDFLALENAGLVERAIQPLRFSDNDVARRAFEDFRPAVPVTSIGIGFAAAGFLIGALVIWSFCAFLRLGFRRRARTA